MKSLRKAARHVERQINRNLYKELEEQRLLIGRLLSNNVKRPKAVKSLKDAEFKVFSQWGEDGIIQYLINILPIENDVFVELGVQNYREANTRFLLMNDNWSGLIVDGFHENVKEIKKSDIYWQYDLVADNTFITKDNIDHIMGNYIRQNNYDPNIGLLSIDLDGIDFYVLDSIKAISPVIIICEYNWIFGNSHEVTIPYNPNFVRTQAHYSNLYWGASIQAIYSKAKEKGYEYVGCTTAGNDAFFVKREYAHEYLRGLITTPMKYYYNQKTKESRDRTGNLTHIGGADRIKLIENMEVLDLRKQKIVTIGSLFSDGGNEEAV